MGKMLGLIELCLDILKNVLKECDPKDSSQSDAIVDYYNQLPNVLICQLEQKTFGFDCDLFKKPSSELKYVTIYKLFLQDFCDKFWLNRQFIMTRHNYCDQIRIKKTTPFVYAARDGHKSVFQMLLNESSLDVNLPSLWEDEETEKNDNYDSALHAVCRRGDMEMIEKLLEMIDNEDPKKRIDVNQRCFNRYAIEIAISRDNWNVAKVLLTKTNSNGQKVLELEPSDWHRLNERIYRGAVYSRKYGRDMVRLLLECPNFHINKETWDPFLNLACRVGNIEVVRVLLGTLKNEDESKRVKVNMQDFNNETALHLACEEGHLEIVKLLLETLKSDYVEGRVKLDIKDVHGKTPLDVAKDSNHPEIVQLLSHHVNIE